MPNFKITAKREIHYYFSIEADSKQEALEEINRIETAEDVEEYAYQWNPMEFLEIEED